MTKEERAKIVLEAAREFMSKYRDRHESGVAFDAFLAGVSWQEKFAER